MSQVAGRVVGKLLWEERSRVHQEQKQMKKQERSEKQEVKSASKKKKKEMRRKNWMKFILNIL